MRADISYRATIDIAMPSAGSPRAAPSLPSAGFRVYRACDPLCTIGLFTTHRAEP